MHLAAAHLEELTRENGHPETGDDEILEAGHRPAKKAKEICLHGGQAGRGGARLVLADEGLEADVGLPVEQQLEHAADLELGLHLQAELGI